MVKKNASDLKNYKLYNLIWNYIYDNLKLLGISKEVYQILQGSNWRIRFIILKGPFCQKVENTVFQSVEIQELIPKSGCVIVNMQAIMVLVVTYNNNNSE